MPIALPAVTQLLTSGAALNASSRYTACGPPAWKLTGMSRPIAADGTISCSTPSAWAGAAGTATTPRPSATTTAPSVRSRNVPALIAITLRTPSVAGVRG